METLIKSEEEEEAEEHATSREEVPDIMIVIEAEDVALLVVVPGLRCCPIKIVRRIAEEVETCIEMIYNWKKKHQNLTWNPAQHCHYNVAIR